MESRLAEAERFKVFHFVVCGRRVPCQCAKINLKEKLKKRSWVLRRVNGANDNPAPVGKVRL